MADKNFFRFALLAVLLVGCTTVKNYDSKAAPGPAKPKDYPIYVYNEKAPVPRPYEVIGKMSIRDTAFTMFGGSLEGEVQTLREAARSKGADALLLTRVEPPDFLHAKYRVEASFLRFTNGWETITISDDELRAYFRDNEAALNPIEGIWQSNDATQSRVAIMQNNTWAGRDFIAIMLSSANPTWQRGDKKLDLAKGERPGVYRGNYYFDDYRRKGVAFTLMMARTNLFILPMADDSPPVIFSKE